MRDAYELILRPILTEKSNILNERNNQVVFEVRWDATKSELKQAVEKIFKVRVEKVRTARISQKRRRYGRKYVRRSRAYKKAIVTLKEGERIEFYEGT